MRKVVNVKDPSCLISDCVTGRGARSRFPGYFLSPLRYPGGKGRLGPWLAQVIQANNLSGGWYIEPYAGGAGAALYLLLEGHVDHVVINDDDPLISAFWHSVVAETEAFAAMIESTPVTMEERRRFEQVVLDHSRYPILEVGFAAFFLNRTSRSGILSGGVIGGKNQVGSYKLDARFNRRTLATRVRAIGARRDQITVLGMDALELLESARWGLPQNCLIYLDPPYFEKGSQLYNNHYARSDHREIAALARSINHPLIITYDDCPEIRGLYRSLPHVEFSLRYSTHTSRPRATELLIYSNLELPSHPRMTRAMTLRSS